MLRYFLASFCCLFLTFAHSQHCVDATTLEVFNTSKGSSFSGPFLPGEEVSFRMIIENYHVDKIGSGNNCQWLHGVVPEFGNGWDENSFDFNGKPLNIITEIQPFETSAVWGWFNNITFKSVSSTINSGSFDDDPFIDICHISEENCSGLPVGPDILAPPGWYAAQNGGDPNEKYGDGNCCHCDIGPWVIEFSLFVREINYEEKNDLTVKFYTFGDGQTGLWGAQTSEMESICGLDEPTIFTAETDCYESIEITSDTNIQICPNTTSLIELETDNPYTQIIYSSTDGSISGTADAWFLTISNDTEEIQSYEFDVQLVSENGCVTEVTTFTVDVTPEIDILLNNESYCSAGEIDLGGNPTATNHISEIFSYEWSINALGSVSNPTLFLESDLTYSLTVTDDNFCTSSAINTIEVDNIGTLEILGETSSCNDLDSLILTTSQDTLVDWYINDEFHSESDSLLIELDSFDVNIFVVSAIIENEDCVLSALDTFYLGTEFSFDFNVGNQSTICAGDSILVAPVLNESYNYSYTWQGSNFMSTDSAVYLNEEGTYILEISSSLGCNSVDTFLLDFQAGNVEIMGNSLTCNEEDDLLLYAEFQGDSSLWTINNIEISNTDSMTINGTNFGTGEKLVVLEIWDSLNCSFTDSVIVNLGINSAPVDLLNDSIAVCSNSSNYLSLNEDYENISWKSPSNTEMQDSILITESGIYSVSVLTQEGCEINDTIHVETISPQAVEIQGIDYTCGAEDLILLIETDSSNLIKWLVDEQLFAENTDTISISSIELGNGAHEVTVEVTDSLNCAVSETKGVFLNVSNFLIFPEDTIQICEGAEVNLTIENPTNVELDVLFISPSGEISIDSVIANEEGNYVIQVGDENICVLNDTISLTFTELSNPSIIGDTEICFGEKTELSLDMTFEMIEWSNSANTPIIEVGAGTYFAMVTDENQCTANSDTIIVTEQDEIIAQFLAESTELEVSLTNSSVNANSYMWDFGDGNSSEEENPIHTYTSQGDYMVTLIATNGNCSDTSTLLIQVQIMAIEELQYQVSIFPNPNSGTFVLQAENINRIQDLKLQDFSGKLYELNMKVENEQILVQADLIAGMYLLSYRIDEKTYSKKLIITN